MNSILGVNNLRIGTKILIALAALVLIICAMGAFSIDRLMRTHETTIEIDKIWLPSVRNIGDIRYNMARHRAIISRHVMAITPDQKAQVEQRARAAEENVDKSRKRYEPLIGSAEARSAYNEFVTAWQAYLAESQKMLAVSRSNDTGAAIKLFVNDVSAEGLKAEATLDKVVSLNLAGAEAAETAGYQLYADSRNLLIAGVGLAFLVSILATVFLRRTVARPVVSMTTAMTKIAAGELETLVPAAGRRDEIGRMAEAVLVFRTQAVESRRQAEREKLAEAEAVEIRRNAILEMADTVENETTGAVEAIASTAREVDSAAQEMVKFAASVSLDTQSVAAASEQALANARTVASAADQLSHSIGEISGHIVRATDVTRLAVASGTTATSTIMTLTEAVTRISDVTKLIGSIASQTNLLALNATIESARAGDAGRGFAVVASEVKNLASQTARSTEEINQQVAAIQSVTDAVASAIMDVTNRIREIDEAASAIARSIEQQGSSTREIAANVSQTAAAAREVSEKIQNVSAGAEQVDGRAKSVRTSIGEVTSKIGGLREILVRVVRTSTGDANRRGAPRFPMADTVEVLDGSNRAQLGKLIDVSETGAHIGCKAESVSGQEGAIKVAGILAPLPFVIRGRNAESINVEFKMPEPLALSYRQWLASRGRRERSLAS